MSLSHLLKDTSVFNGTSMTKESTAKNTGFDKLIPDLRDWNGGRGTDIGSWIRFAGDFQKAIGYSTIFWPNFVEHEGYILREGFSPNALKRYCKECSCKRTVESAMNALRIADLHYSGCHDASPERLIYIGNVLKQIYECKLAFTFPDIAMEVVFDDTYKDDLSAYLLTFYQK